MEQTMVRTSERGTFKRCPQRWWWSSVEGLAPKEPSKALWFGTGWHLVLAEYYKPGFKRSKDYIDLWREFCDTPDAHGQYQRVEDMGEEWVDLRALGEIMLHGYVEHWGGDKSWDIVQTEYMGSVRIPVYDGDEKFQYNFTFDGVYRDKHTKQFGLLEHKTCAGQPSLGKLVLDDQAGSYWAVAGTILRHRGVLKAGQQIKRIVYNFARKGKPDERPVGPDGQRHNKPNKQHYAEALGLDPAGKLPTIAKMEAEAEERGIAVYGDISARQEAPLFVRHPVIKTAKERQTQINRIKAEQANMEAMRSGRLPVYKTPDDSCSWQCPFYTMCELHDAQGDIDEFKKQVYVIRDAHEVYTTERKVA